MMLQYDLKNGGISALINPLDKYAMNWVEGTSTWGTVKGGTCTSWEELENGIRAVYETRNLTVTVTRELVGDRLRETYAFKNRLSADVFFHRGELGIYATFNDNYEAAPISMTQRCHTHIWCGGNTAWVRAIKMGLCDFGLGLVLTQGSLDSYSVERENCSEDRGDFILHPSPFHLKPGEEKSLSWELFWFREGTFEACLSRYPQVIRIQAEHFTVFENEMIRFSADRPDAEIFLDGEPISAATQDGKTLVEYSPARLGEHCFTVRWNGLETFSKFFVQLPLKELLHRRAHFIDEKQQFHCQGSPLDGAYLIYDNQDRCQYFDNLNGDYNASRERLGMGIFMARYLQRFPDEALLESLMKYYRFVTREFYDEENGAVYNTVGMDPSYKRLYNAPWMSTFVTEMYRLTGDEGYLDKLFKLLEVYYSIGGEQCYPNGMSLLTSVEALRQGGHTDQAEKLTGMYRKHVERFVETGTNYPGHEVKYEQSIVSPGAAFTAQMYLLEPDQQYLEACRDQIRILERFSGDQPSHHLYEQAIRHWDGFWFGKRRIYGDTFPHAATVHTADAFALYAKISGDETYRRRGEDAARSVLSLFNPDGTASNAYVYPLTVNGMRCEYYDEFANDQDGALYFLLKFFDYLI